MIAALIAISVIVFAGSIVIVVCFHVKKTEKQKYYAAAGNIMREDFLNYSLRNAVDDGANNQQPRMEKMMVYLKSRGGGQKQRFVFDPEKKIMLGRDGNSNIFINDVRVSQQHCVIYSADNVIYLQDLGSVNGTVVRRGVFKRYRLTDGSQILLKTGDIIEIGGSSFKVCLFYFDYFAAQV